MTESQQRICPVCGTLTTESFCPKEGASTVVARSFSKHPRNYEVGDLVGERYRITGALGSGGYAAVYSAEHTGTGQQVAVKLMAFDPTADGGQVAVRRFFREARITAGLSHPHTVRVFDVGQDDGGALYIAMELLRGESLEGLLKRVLTAGEVLTEGEALDIMIPVLESLAEAHDRQLVHRDLKPANIFLVKDADGAQIVKVLDFGIARTADSSLTVGGTIPGTPPFMSPEQCRGEPLDGRSDLYSLAVLLFLCVVGRLPFHDTNVLRLMRMHAFDPPPDPRTMTSRPLSDGMVHVLMRTLAKQPSERPASAAELVTELHAIREGRWQPVGLDSDTVAEATVIDDDMPTTATKIPLRRRPSSDIRNSPTLPDDTDRDPAAQGAGVALADDAGVSADASQGAPVAAPPTAAPPTPREPPEAAAEHAGRTKRDRSLIGVAFLVLVVGGVALGVMLGKQSGGESKSDVQASVVFGMAQEARDPVRKLDFARQAVKLAPDNATYRDYLSALERARPATRRGDAPAAGAVPGRRPAKDSAAAPAAQAAAPVAGRKPAKPVAKPVNEVEPALADVPPPPVVPAQGAAPADANGQAKPRVEKKRAVKPAAKPKPKPTANARPPAASDSLKPALMD